MIVWAPCQYVPLSTLRPHTPDDGTRHLQLSLHDGVLANMACCFSERRGGVGKRLIVEWARINADQTVIAIGHISPNLLPSTLKSFDICLRFIPMTRLSSLGTRPIAPSSVTFAFSESEEDQ